MIFRLFATDLKGKKNMSVRSWFNSNVSIAHLRCCSGCISAKEYHVDGSRQFDYCQLAVDETGCQPSEAVIDTAFFECSCKRFEITPEYARELKAEQWWLENDSWYRPACQTCGRSSNMESSDKLYCTYMKEETGLPEKNCFVDKETACPMYTLKNKTNFKNFAGSLTNER